MDYDSIHFTFFAVNGAGNGTKANFTYLLKKESGLCTLLSVSCSLLLSLAFSVLYFTILLYFRTK